MIFEMNQEFVSDFYQKYLELKKKQIQVGEITVFIKYIYLWRFISLLEKTRGERENDTEQKLPAGLEPGALQLHGQHHKPLGPRDA